MTYCTCWCEYPNENYKQKNGKWKCVDRYKCIRPLEVNQISGRCKRKTMCECIKPRVKMAHIPIDTLREDIINLPEPADPDANSAYKYCKADILEIIDKYIAESEG